MSQLSLVCLSLTSNLRCIGFTLGQFEALIIPPIIEVIVALLFIYLCSGPARWAQILLAADSVLYFIWALLDMLSHVIPAAQTSLSLFKALDLLVGAASFTPILIYSIYLYRLSFCAFIPNLPRKLQPYLGISLPALLVIAVAINEVSSFVGTYIGSSSNSDLIIWFSHDSESLWRSLSNASLSVFTTIQFLFFLLAFSRLSSAFLDQRRIALTHSDEHHYFHGIVWITAGIIVGVVETTLGFAQVSFGVSLARRILRLSARAVLLYGLLHGLDAAENFEGLAEELRGVSRINKRISTMLGVNPQRLNTFRRLSQSHAEQTHASAHTSTKEQSRDQRVTIHYEKGQAPFLQIRFSTFDFPTQTVFTDLPQRRRRSLSGLKTACSDDVSSGVANARNTRRAVSVPVPIDSDHHISAGWTWEPERVHLREGSNGNDSDNLSVIRDIERKFPNLPPRVTGKYRGSILGENYEHDPFPVVGVSRQSSLCREGSAPNTSDGGCTSAALSSNGSIKRKPAPPPLETIPDISSRRRRPSSTWGGLTVKTLVDSISNPSEGTTICSPNFAQPREPRTSRSRRTTRDLIKRASSAMSDASVCSAEWLASASSPRSARTPLTATDIEMYRRGNIGVGLARPKSCIGKPSPSDNNPPEMRTFTDDTGAPSRPSHPHITSHSDIGHTVTYATPAPVHPEFNSGYANVPSLEGSVTLDGSQSRTRH